MRARLAHVLEGLCQRIGQGSEGWKAAHEQSEKDAAKAKARAAKAQAAGAGSRKKGKNIMDIFMEKGEALVTFDSRAEGWSQTEGLAKQLFAEMEPIGERIPAFAICGLDFKDVEDESSDVGKSLAEFRNNFAASPWRDTAERATRASLDSDRKDTSSNELLAHRLSKFSPRGAVLASSTDEKSKLKGDACLSNFGLKQGSFHVSTEKSNLWTSRLSTAGTRSVAGAVAPGDVLWIPANVVVAEQVTDGADCFGLRWAMVLDRDTARFKAFENVAASKLNPATHVSKAIVAAAAKTAGD